MKRIIVFFLLILCLTQCAHGIDKKLTLLLYMAPDQEARPYVSFSCRQLELEGAPKRAHILLCITHRIGLGRYRVTRHALEGKMIALIEEKHVTDVTEQELLSDALKWAETYQAEHFGLIIWSRYPSHTQGSIGVRLDRSGQRFLSDRDLRQTFQTASRKIDFLGLDANGTATLELAWALSPHVRYLVASGQSNKFAGWPYHLLLKAFKQTNKEVRPLLRTLVGSFGNYYRLLMKEYHVALFDVTYIKPLVHHVRTMAQTIKEIVRNDQTRQVLRQSFVRALRWKEGGYADLGDWYTKLLASPLLDAATKRVCAQVSELIKQCIIASANHNSKPKQSLGLYLPLHEHTGAKQAYQTSLWAQDGRWRTLLDAGAQ